MKTKGGSLVLRSIVPTSWRKPFTSRWNLGWGKGRGEPWDTEGTGVERSTERVPTEEEVCISVVLGILGSNIFPKVNEKRLGKRWARHPKL